jgi:hypothetical protein
MTMDPALRITAFGEVDQRLLDQLRHDLDLRSAGRLTDEEDSTMGVRRDDVGEGNKIWRSLSRNSPGSWTFSVSYEGQQPSGELIDRYRAEARSAFERAGLVVNREWRK